MGSKRVVKDAVTIQDGLEYFFKDQNRYPSTGEFKDINLMGSYISNFPPQSFVSDACPYTFDYFNPSPFTYELKFCIPAAVGTFPAGISKFTKK
jgi:hypothetical protein